MAGSRCGRLCDLCMGTHRAGGETIVTVMNLSDQFWKDFPVGLPMYYELEELLDPDWKELGGNTSPRGSEFPYCR